ncbi:MAG: hypothetical protein KDC42_02290 [Ignavibacteriae bacterium]|nr:hypothetical protein [Ignavibacteriota bacterium]
MDKNLQNKNLEDRIDKTLEVAESLKKQEIKPYFYTRLMAKIESEKRGHISEPAFLGFSRKLAMGFVALLLVANSLTVYFTLSGDNTATERRDQIDAQTTRQENIEKVADEYFGGGDYYNY